MQRIANSSRRASQSLCNDRCQNILYKAVFEHFIEIKWIAILLLASKSFQNSSFGANFLVNFVVDKDSISLLESVLSPSSCFSLQFLPSLHIWQLWPFFNISPRISHFLGELVNTKYLRSSLRSLTLDNSPDEVLFFFGSSSNDSWPHLQYLTLKHCGLNDGVLEVISKTAFRLRTVDLSYNSAITDSSLEHLSNLSSITSLNLSGCDEITGVGLKHVAKLSGITSLNLSFGKKITDVGLEHISKLSHITSLDLHRCHEITDAGLEHISKLSDITSLDLQSCDGITDAGLEHVAKLSRLTSLDLAGCKQITNTGLGHVGKLSSITWLKLFGCGQITDAGLDHISKLSGITDLSLTFCDKITDDGLQQLSVLSGLTSLDLTFCRVSDEAKSKLKTVVPNCTIISAE